MPSHWLSRLRLFCALFIGHHALLGLWITDGHGRHHRGSVVRCLADPEVWEVRGGDVSAGARGAGGRCELGSHTVSEALTQAGLES